MMRILILLAAALVSAVVADDPAPRPIKCQKTMAASDLPAQLKLPLNYASVVRYTNWDNSETAKISEQNFTSSLIVKKVDRSGSEHTFIVAAGGKEVLVYNSATCTNSTPESVLPALYPLPGLISANLTKNAHSLAGIIDALLVGQSTFEYKAYNETDTVGGIDALGWVGCAFNVSANASALGYQVEVFYASDKSQQPYSADYKNPVVLSVHFTVFSDVNKTFTAVSHYSLDVVELEKLAPEAEAAATTLPRGIFCSNMTTSPLPVTIPSRFGATIDYTNPSTKQVNTVSLVYDSILKITSFSLDFTNDADIPFISGVTVPKNLTTATLYRDFNYGIQYVLSKDGRVCRTVEPLDGRYGDAVTTNGTIELRSSAEVLLNVTNDQFYKSSSKSIDGVDVETYVSRVESTDGGSTVVEVNLVRDDWTLEGVKGSQLHSIVHYHYDKDAKKTLETFIHFDSFQNYTAIGPVWFKSNAYPCLFDSPDSNMFYIRLANVTLNNVRTYGSENVEAALAEAISTAVNVSVLRISYILMKQANSTTLVCFLLGEATKVAQTPTAYLKPELTVAQFRDAFNQTLINGTIVAPVTTEAQAAVAISVDHFGVFDDVESHPAPEPPKFVGYSGGSMFILAIFSFIFGAGIAVGLYIFYNKGRAISGMAYQVFE
uniref:Protein kinase domain-containing protein n=1 Tax=Panagrellus redivivus TaxID=6233 RepID=A0A7E4VCB7_PANRE